MSRDDELPNDRRDNYFCMTLSLLPNWTNFAEFGPTNLKHHLSHYSYKCMSHSFSIMPTIPFGIQTIHAYSLLELLLGRGRVSTFKELSMSYPIVN